MLYNLFLAEFKTPPLHCSRKMVNRSLTIMFTESTEASLVMGYLGDSNWASSWIQTRTDYLVVTLSMQGVSRKKPYFLVSIQTVLRTALSFSKIKISQGVFLKSQPISRCSVCTKTSIRAGSAWYLGRIILGVEGIGQQLRFCRDSIVDQLYGATQSKLNSSPE